MKNDCSNLADIQPGDTIITLCNKYIVGEVVEDRPQPMILPEGGDDYTYLIPLENIIEVIKKEQSDETQEQL